MGAMGLVYYLMFQTMVTWVYETLYRTLLSILGAGFGMLADAIEAEITETFRHPLRLSIRAPRLLLDTIWNFIIGARP